ncbi:MAG: hypothetical protein ACKVWV_17945 [Planctomycetota bacterium]
MAQQVAPPTADELVARPLSVNGRAIPTDEIRRQLIHDVGQPMLDGILSRFFVEHRADIAKLATESAAVAVALDPVPEPTDEEIAIVLRDATKHFEPRTPATIEAWTRRLYQSVDWYPRVMREHLRFNSVFLANDPKRWPDVTVEAVRRLHEDDPQETVAYDLDVFRERAARNGEPLVAEQSMWWPLFRDAAQSVWLKRWNVRTALDGLSCDRILSIDIDGDGAADWELRTADAWSEVAGGIDPCDVSNTRRWLAASRAIRDQLERDGASVDARSAAKFIAELEARARGACSRVDHERHARELGFPSALAYCEYRELEESFRVLVDRHLAANPPGRLVDVYNAKGARATDRLLGGQATAEFLLVSAFDSDRGTWKPNGWSSAAARAETIHAALTAAGSSATAWNDQVAAHSEFWQAPSMSCLGPVILDGPKRPRRALQSFDDWDRALAESPYTRISNGFSLADHARYEQPVGTIEGPFRGPHGFYFVNVLSRKPAKRKLRADDVTAVRFIRDECLRLTFLDYAREALAQADIQGLEDR